MTQHHQPTVTLKEGREESVHRFHPWIFSGALERVEGDPKTGQRVRVTDSRGDPLGWGHFFDSNIAVKLLTFGSGEITPDFFLKKIEEAFQLRVRLGLCENSDNTAFRLVHGEGDGLPGVVIDLFGDIAVIEYHSAGMIGEQSHLIAALQVVLGSRLRAVFSKSGDLSEWAWGEPIDNPLEIRENGLRFQVNIRHGQKTGYFLDQRDSRRRVREYCRNATVLDCFSYSGSFSVNALQGGAASLTVVDSSGPALELAKINLIRNFPAAQPRFVQEDCLQYLHHLDQRYNVIILDPPAFVKHRGALAGGTRGYETINLLAFQQIESNGLLATFSCSQLVDRELFRKIIFKAAARSKRRVQIIDEFRQAPCHPVSIFHPEGEYLKGLLLRVV